MLWGQYAQSSGQAPVLMDSSVLICTQFGRCHSRCTRWASNNRSLNGRARSACASASVPACPAGGRGWVMGGSCTSVEVAMFPAGSSRVNQALLARSTIAQFSHSERRARGGRSGVEVLQRDADEDRHADVVVVEECLQAGGRLAAVDEPLLMNEAHTGRDDPRVVPGAELQAAAAQTK